MSDAVAWFRKQCHDEQEVENLRFILKLRVEGIPTIGQIADRWYDVELCEPYERADVTSHDICAVLRLLDSTWHQIRSPRCTAGIYKFLRPHPLHYYIPLDEPYWNHIVRQLKRLVDDVNRRAPGILPEWTQGWVENVADQAYRISDEGCGPFVLLHGDLHFGNIVKKSGRPLLVDYEHARFGPRELDVANLVIHYVIACSHNTQNIVGEFVDLRQTVARLMKWEWLVGPQFLSFCGLMAGLESISYRARGDQREAELAEALMFGSGKV